MLHLNSVSGFGGRSDLSDWYSKGLSTENVFKSGSRNPLDIYGWASGFLKGEISIARDSSEISPYGGTPMKMTVTGTLNTFIASYSTSSANLAAAADDQTWSIRFLAKGATATSVGTYIFGARSTGAYISTDTGTYNNKSFNITTKWQEYNHTFTFNNTSGFTIAYIQMRFDALGGVGSISWLDGLQVYRIN